MSLVIGGIECKPLTQSIERISGIIWGPAKSGKTTLTSTAPKPILYLMFDPDGAACLMRNEDIHVLDLSQAPDRVVESFKTPDTQAMRDLEKHLTTGIKTVIFDSLTSFGGKALCYGVQLGAMKAGTGEKPTLEQPGYVGYGYKNTSVNQAMKTLLYMTKQHNIHFFAIGHEDAPKMDSKGQAIISQTIMLGSSLVVEVPKDVSEVWYMHDKDSKREIILRPRHPLKPMGSRMFDTRNVSGFYWRYDAVTQQGEGIEAWYEAWKANEFNKISVPK